MFEKTYHHLIYGIYDVKHLVPGDVAVIIKVVQFKGPCVEKHVKVLRGGPTSVICDMTNSPKAILRKQKCELETWSFQYTSLRMEEETSCVQSIEFGNEK